MSSVQPASPAVRWIDHSGTVVERNKAMSTLTSGPEHSQRCHEQLRGPFCGTERCMLARIRDCEAKHLDERVEMKPANGPPIRGRLFAEAYTSGTGNFEGIIETFVPLPGPIRLPNTASNVVVPQPVDEQSFRAGLSRLLNRAAAKDVAIENRSWDCQTFYQDDRWDVMITRVRSQDGAEKE